MGDFKSCTMLRMGKSLAKLQAVAKHVKYEMDMLLYAHDRKLQFDQSAAYLIIDPRDRYLVLESCLLHCRNIIHFFYANGGSDDVLCVQYTGGKKTTPPVWTEEFRVRCNKLLAHVTYKRIDFELSGQMNWAFIDEKVRLLKQQWDDFLSSLPEERRAWFY